MNKTKWIVRVAMCVALLIGGQLALTGISGIEIVTVMLLSFCFCYGIRLFLGLDVLNGYSVML